MKSDVKAKNGVMVRSSLRVLIADDDPEWSEALEQYLACKADEWGFEIITCKARGGYRTVASAIQFVPDAVIMGSCFSRVDYSPSKSVIMKFRSHEELKNTFVLVVDQLQAAGLEDRNSSLEWRVSNTDLPRSITRILHYIVSSNRTKESKCHDHRIRPFKCKDVDSSRFGVGCVCSYPFAFEKVSLEKQSKPRRQVHALVTA